MRLNLENQRRVGGFTLLEVLISIVIITIALFGVLLTQVTSIQGYSSARDYTRASELGKVTTELLHIEGSTWSTGSLTTTDWGATPGDDSPFDAGLSDMAGAGWDWIVLTDDPVDERLARDDDLTGGRFCILARGDYMEFDTQDLNTYTTPGDLSTFQDSPVFQVQIAVVYSGPTANPISDCDNGIETDDLVPNDPDAIETLELAGQRVAFFGTVITRRDWQ